MPHGRAVDGNGCSVVESLSFTASDVESAARIRDFVVQSRVDIAIFQGQQSSSQFDSTGAGIKVSDVAFECCDGDFQREITEDTVVSPRLHDVVRLRAFALCVDVAKILRGNAGGTDGGFHGSDKPQPGGFICHATAIAASAGTQHFRVDLCTTADGVFVALHDERRGAFTDNGAIAFEIEGAACAGRIIRPA